MKFIKAYLYIGKLTILLISLFFFTSNIYSYDKKGSSLGASGNFELVMPTISSDSSYKTTYLYGGMFNGQYMFYDFLGIGVGLGLKYYTLKFEHNNTNYEAINLIIAGYLTIRFRPMPLLTTNSPFTFYIGAGFGFSKSLYAKQHETSKGVTETSTGTFKLGATFLSEAGIGYYITKNILLELSVSYSLALNNIYYSSVSLKPNKLGFALAFSYII